MGWVNLDREGLELRGKHFAKQYEIHCELLAFIWYIQIKLF